MSLGEWRTIRTRHGLPAGATIVPVPPPGGVMVVADDGQTCAYLAGGRCTIHEDRPKICRMYGNDPDLPCEYLFPKEALVIANRFRARLREALQERLKEKNT